MEENRGEPSTSVEAEKEEDEEDKVGGEMETPGEGSKATRPLQTEIDKILEDGAHKKNLSVMNVKSILRVSHIEWARGVSKNSCYLRQEVI